VSGSRYQHVTDQHGRALQEHQYLIQDAMPAFDSLQNEVAFNRGTIQEQQRYIDRAISAFDALQDDVTLDRRILQQWVFPTSERISLLTSLDEEFNPP
jgi:hypothetical protein